MTIFYKFTQDLAEKPKKSDKGHKELDIKKIQDSYLQIFNKNQ